MPGHARASEDVVPSYGMLLGSGLHLQDFQGGYNYNMVDRPRNQRYSMNVGFPRQSPEMSVRQMASICFQASSKVHHLSMQDLLPRSS